MGFKKKGLALSLCFVRFEGFLLRCYCECKRANSTCLAFHFTGSNATVTEGSKKGCSGAKGHVNDELSALLQLMLCCDGGSVNPVPDAEEVFPINWLEALLAWPLLLAAAARRCISVRKSPLHTREGSVPTNTIEPRKAA